MVSVRCSHRDQCRIAQNGEVCNRFFSSKSSKIIGGLCLLLPNGSHSTGNKHICGVRHVMVCTAVLQCKVRLRN